MIQIWITPSGVTPCIAGSCLSLRTPPQIWGHPLRLRECAQNRVNHIGGLFRRYAEDSADLFRCMLNTMMLTAKQVAEMLGLSRSKVYELASSAKLPSYRFDGALRFASSDVETFIAASRVAAHPMPNTKQPLRGVTLKVGRGDGESDLEKYFRAHGLKPKSRR